MRKLIAAFCVACVVSSASMAAPKSTRPTTSTADKGTAYAAKVADALDKTLKDYPSARFREVKIHLFDDGSGFESCGYVNSKNSAGGYVGWTQFLVIGPAVMLAEHPAMATVVNDTCADPTIKWLPRDYAAAVSPK